MTRVSVAVERIPGTDDLPLPSYATAESAGMDLYAALESELNIPAGHRALIPTGIKLAIPPGFEGQVRARSGLAIKHGLGLVNAPGTIDSDYRGEVQVIMINWSDSEYTVKRGERIAQLVLAPVVRADLVEERHLDLTERGEGGFGHTGA